MSMEEMILLIMVFYDEKINSFRVLGKIRFDNGIKIPLIFYDVIYLTSNLGNICSGFSYNLQPYALEFLNNNLKDGNINIQERTFRLQK